MNKAYKIKVFGDVQGVSFRHFAKKKATELGLVGWAENKHDGSVRLFVQGEEDSVEEFIEWCREGSPMATVQSQGVERVEIDPRLSRFEVR